LPSSHGINNSIFSHLCCASLRRISWYWEIFLLNINLPLRSAEVCGRGRTQLGSRTLGALGFCHSEVMRYLRNRLLKPDLLREVSKKTKNALKYLSGVVWLALFFK
jgi:hypothetical protein